ncbi:MAG TPA: hypothetical protein VIF09_02890, partial [Polyangiaceae bacterium]
MTRRSNTWLSITVAVAALSPLVACSSAPTEPGAASSHEVSPASGAAPLSESDRVHAYLEGRYPSSAVKHSFRTALGQTVDCVDFLQTPGVRAMAARGEPITAMPKPPAPHTRTLRDGTTMTEPLQLAPASEGVDEDGHDRLCPDGTVLQIRLTPEEIAQEGGLDAYRRARQRHAPPRAPHGASPSSAAATPSGTHAPAGAPPTMWPCQSGEFHDYAHVIG